MTKSKIKELIEENISILDDEVKVQDDDNIFKLGFVDSLFALKLVNFIEENLGIELDNADLDIENFCSINRIMEFIQSKRDR